MQNKPGRLRTPAVCVTRARACCPLRRHFVAAGAAGRLAGIEAAERVGKVRQSMRSFFGGESE